MKLFTTHFFTVDLSVISSIQHVRAVSRTFPAKIIVHNQQGVKIIDAEYQLTDILVDVYTELLTAWQEYAEHVKAGEV